MLRKLHDAAGRMVSTLYPVVARLPVALAGQT
ncbi:Uncharacterised protein [Bordetella pertussis]|nr:Uncharacterised protein [Bordetella pertussis]CFP69528.1 Uncharacterised protein [Bordetella pertussis]